MVLSTLRMFAPVTLIIYGLLVLGSSGHVLVSNVMYHPTVDTKSASK